MWTHAAAFITCGKKKKLNNTSYVEMMFSSGHSRWEEGETSEGNLTSLTPECLLSPESPPLVVKPHLHMVLENPAWSGGSETNQSPWRPIGTWTAHKPSLTEGQKYDLNSINECMLKILLRISSIVQVLTYCCSLVLWVLNRAVAH